MVVSAEKILEQLEDADLGGRSPAWGVCWMCAQTLPVTGAGMALVTARGAESLIAASDATAARLEELQFDAGEGPCTDAVALGRPVLHPDLVRTGVGRWPALAAPALQAGIAAVFAFPVHLGTAPVGALDLYRDTPGELSDTELAQGMAFAEAAGQVLARLQEQAPGAIHPDLVAPHDERLRVHQATGMISVQAAVGVNDALLLLRARAYSEGRGLVAVAGDVITKKISFAQETAGFHDEQ